ncbi:RagB/SusD family nutrient uptake outer membrane protein [Myroides profundi]|uniref:SusD family protein n=1 Tax=Myroides profundi TaxID=480520 RepID=A0AAJ5BEB4_MYRPR|nr:RagB/SusD family nutrient uptake outer membrane protein [Myroides profundi]AJH13864.1 hypothetical protein MPR_0664 [Myroides profundi]SER03704.1 SusD family protein [Myroides profundi]
MIKKIFYLFVFSSLWGCSLENKSENEISGNDIINSPIKAYGVLSQAYKATPIQPKDYTLYTEDLQPSYLINYLKGSSLAYKWDETTLSINSSLIWNNHYDAIVHLNVLLESDHNFNSQDPVWQYIKGSALVLKAYNYFDLLQLYSERYNPTALGIIAKDKLIVEEKARLTQEESLKLIKTYLSEGLDLIKQSGKHQNYFIKEKGINILQARVAMYEKEYAKAESIAQELVNDGAKLPTSTEDYRNIWTSDNTNIYWLYNNLDNPNHYLYYEDNQGDLLYINEDYNFDLDDIRYAVSQYKHSMKATAEDKIERSLLGKYKRSQLDKDPRDVVMIRSTEAYFILAESLLEQNKLAQAKEVLNTFLSAINQPNIEDTPSQQELRHKLHFEKQKEFIGEKNNLFDLKRWNTPIERKKEDSNTIIIKIEPNDYRWTWPIPMNELRYNSNAQQNKGWPSFK